MENLGLILLTIYVSGMNIERAWRIPRGRIPQTNSDAKVTSQTVSGKERSSIELKSVWWHSLIKPSQCLSFPPQLPGFPAWRPTNLPQSANPGLWKHCILSTSAIPQFPPACAHFLLKRPDLKPHKLANDESIVTKMPLTICDGVGMIVTQLYHPLLLSPWLWPCIKWLQN